MVRFLMSSCGTPVVLSNNMLPVDADELAAVAATQFAHYKAQQTAAADLREKRGAG